jgi:hypothetical protein
VTRILTANIHDWSMMSTLTGDIGKTILPSTLSLVKELLGEDVTDDFIVGDADGEYCWSLLLLVVFGNMVDCFAACV